MVGGTRSPRNRAIHAVSMVVVTLLALDLIAGCDSKDPTGINEQALDSALVGTWDVLFMTQGLDTVPFPEGQWIWAIGDRYLCTCTRLPDGTYAPDVAGTYTVSAPCLFLSMSNGGSWELDCEMSAGLDTVQLSWSEDAELGTGALCLRRVSEVPDFDYCR
jgi:hypothetical protein